MVERRRNRRRKVLNVFSPPAFSSPDRARRGAWGGEEPREEDLSVFRKKGERDPSFDLTLSSSSSSPETTKVFSSSSLPLLSSQRSVADQTEKGCCLGGEVACEQAPFGGSRSRSGSVPLFLRPPPPPLSQRLNPSTFPPPPLPPRNGGNSRSSSKHIGGGEWLPSFPFPPPPPFFLRGYGSEERKSLFFPFPFLPIWEKAKNPLM